MLILKTQYINTGKHNVIFVKNYSFNARTVINDVDILKGRFNVTMYNAKMNKSLQTIYSFVRQFFFFLFKTSNFSLIYIWFADYHSVIPVFFAKIFGKKSIVNVGGYDATYIPEINCGAFNKSGIINKLRYWCLKYTFNNCSYIITVDDTMIINQNSYIFSNEGRVLFDGIKTFLPNLSTNIKTVFTCYDISKFSRTKNTPKERIVISVGLTPNDDEFRRKGFDMLVSVAKIMTDTQFILIGVSEYQETHVNKLGLRNLTLKNKVPQEQLIEYFSRAKVFAQLSLFEGLPNTLCEAMLCECVPVGSNVNGIPTAIGDTGFIVYKKDINEITEKLKLALETTEETGKQAREKIIKEFTIQARKEKLNFIIDSLLNENS